jgi:hypothetical protein
MLSTTFLSYITRRFPAATLLGLLLLVGVLAATPALAQPALAQENAGMGEMTEPPANNSPGSPSAEDNSVQLNVGVAAARPGEPIDIPVTLSGPEGSQLMSAVVHVSFPNKYLNYTGSQKGLAVELADGDVQIADKASGPDTMLEISVTSKTCVKAGILAYFSFQAAADTPKGEIPLKLVDYKATSCQGGPLELAKGDDGLITMFASEEEIPMLGCFFFTH